MRAIPRHVLYPSTSPLPRCFHSVCMAHGSHTRQVINVAHGTCAGMVQGCAVCRCSGRGTSSYRARARGRARGVPATRERSRGERCTDY